MKSLAWLRKIAGKAVHVCVRFADFNLYTPKMLSKDTLKPLGDTKVNWKAGATMKEISITSYRKTLARIYMTLQVRKQMKEKGNVVELNNRLVIL